MSLQKSQVPTTITHTHKNGIKDVFEIHEKLGHGGLATVYRVTHQRTNKDYAMKIISKQFLQTKGEFALQKLKDEMKIQKKLNHPNILQSKMTFSDQTNYYIVLEYCPGKSIREYLKKKKTGYLTEPETKKILRDVLRGLIYLHNRNIVHHDLKLENFIIDSEGTVKIADFGLATYFNEDDDSQSLIVGTINYLSPEIIQKEGNGFESDIWAIGVSTFIMLTGQSPFGAIRREIIFDKIRNIDYHFPSKVFISPDAKRFITSILRKNPHKRPTASDLLNNVFLAKIDRQFVQLYKPEKTSQTVQPPVEIPKIQKVIPKPRTRSTVDNGNLNANNNIYNVVKDIKSKGGHVSKSLRILYANSLGIKTLETEESEGTFKRESSSGHSKHRSHIHKFPRPNKVSTLDDMNSKVKNGANNQAESAN